MEAIRGSGVGCVVRSRPLGRKRRGAMIRVDNAFIGSELGEETTTPPAILDIERYAFRRNGWHQRRKADGSLPAGTRVDLAANSRSSCRFGAQSNPVARN